MTNSNRIRIRTAAQLAGVAAIVTLLAGCQGSGLPDRPAGASVGPASACPGTYLHSLANDRTEAGAGVDVTEVTDPEKRQQFSELSSESPVCVAQLIGNRTLPSGAKEPTEYIALYKGELRDAIIATAKEKGYTSSNEVFWRNGSQLLTVRQEPAQRLGIEGADVHTLVSKMDSEELANIRSAR